MLQPLIGANLHAAQWLNLRPDGQLVRAESILVIETLRKRSACDRQLSMDAQIRALAWIRRRIEVALVNHFNAVTARPRHSRRQRIAIPLDRCSEKWRIARPHRIDRSIRAFGDRNSRRGAASEATQ